MQPLVHVAWNDQPATPPDELTDVARMAVPLDEAFLTLRRYQEAQARTAADLLERETWTVQELLTRSAPVWQLVAQPTLRFEVDMPGATEQAHLELGRFAHLADLDAPTEQEQVLASTTEPCWARVTPHRGRQQAGKAGALACSYTPISIGEAVTTLGCRRITSQIVDATCGAGRVLMAQAQVQGERTAALLDLEQQLRVASDTTIEGDYQQAAVSEERVFPLLGLSGRAWLVLGRICKLRTRGGWRRW